MYRVLGLLVAVLWSSGAWAAAPDEVTTGFNVGGGHYEKWTVNPYLRRPGTPVNLHFMLTETNADGKWGSNLAFFFGTREDADDGQAPGTAVKEIRLRFGWDADRRAFLPVFRTFSSVEEKDLARMDTSIALNEPARLSVGKVEDGGRSVFINGKKAPVRLDPRLDRFSILVSGVAGTISTSRALLSSPSRALEPAGEYHVTTSFKVQGGYYKMWTMDEVLAQTDTGPVDMRFVLTGRNRDVKWSSNIGFFFAPEAPADVGKRAAGRVDGASNELRLRFKWQSRGFFPQLSNWISGEEKNRRMLKMRTRMNEPVTLSVRKNEKGGRSLFVNGEELPVHLDPKLNRLSIVVSGVEGTITMPSF